MQATVSGRTVIYDFTAEEVKMLKDFNLWEILLDNLNFYEQIKVDGAYYKYES